MIINNNEQSQKFNQKCVKEIIDTIEYALKGCCSLVGFISVNVETCDLRIHTEVANEVVRYFKEKGFNCRENSDNIILEDFDERHKKYLRDCCSDEKIKEEAIRLKNDLFVYLKQYFRPNGHCYTIGSVECDGCNCTWGLVAAIPIAWVMRRVTVRTLREKDYIIVVMIKKKNHGI